MALVLRRKRLLALMLVAVITAIVIALSMTSHLALFHQMVYQNWGLSAPRFHETAVLNYGPVVSHALIITWGPQTSL